MASLMEELLNVLAEEEATFKQLLEITSRKTQIIVQNDIDFCECGGVFHIDYFFLTPSCYLHHLQRTVKVRCADASIAPNKEENQFKKMKNELKEYNFIVTDDKKLEKKGPQQDNTMKH